MFLRRGMVRLKSLSFLAVLFMRSGTGLQAATLTLRGLIVRLLSKALLGFTLVF